MNKVVENWTSILQTLRREYNVTDAAFRTWLKPLTVYKVEGNVVTIVLPSDLRELGIVYISNNYTLPFQVIISEIAGIEDCKVKFIYQDDIPEKDTISSASKQNHQLQMQKQMLQDSRYSDAHLNPKYTFETFVVGSNNKLAHAAAVAVAESPGVAYNPLFIYGGAGLGKTHLMHSIAHYILEKDDNSKVLYVTSEEFTNELIDTIRNGNNTAMSKFREKYRNIDVLLVDDIQFIIGKESTQEEFFHTFNSLHSAKKQIIISSDKPPKDMEVLEERFRSRFEWGLIADITMPDYETRMAILHKKEELDGYTNIPEEVIQYIANHIKSNIRELEGAFNRIVALAKLEKKEVTLDLAEKALQDIVSPSEKKGITANDILNAVCDYYQVSTNDVIGKKRVSKFVQPRQMVMYLCREITTLPLKDVGKILGDRDHSTIIHGIDKIEKELASNETLKSDVNALKKRLNP